MTSALHSQLSIINSPLPSGYKQTEVGVIPEEWDVRSIGHTFRLVNGCAFKPEDWKQNGTPIIRIQNLNDPSASFNYSQVPVPEKNRVEPGDLLFAWSGTLGTSFGARVWTGPSGVLNQHIFRVLMDERQITLPFSLLVFARIEVDIAKQAHGFKTSFVHVKKSDLVKVSLPLPPLPEQRAIATVLSDVDVLLGGLNRLIAKKRDLKQAAMQQLLTGQTRLPGFRVKVQAFKQTEIGKLPNDWDVERVRNLADISTGSRNTQDRVEDGAYPFFVRSATVERINSYSFDGEAVLTAGDGVGTGKIFHYIKGKFDIHQRVYKMSDFSERLNGRFFFLVFSTRFYDRIMSLTAKSSVDSVRMEMIANMLIPLPSADEQTAIAAVLTDMDAELAALEQRQAKTRALKQGMMQELLTGKTRLIENG